MRGTPTHLTVNLLLALLWSHLCFTQDIHWSQFHLARVIFNPAQAGLFSGNWRAALNAREQWTSLPVPYYTVALWADVGIEPLHLKNTRAGTGMLILHDRAGPSPLASTYLGIPIAAHLHLKTRRISQLVSAGLGLGVTFRHIKWDNLVFGTQWAEDHFDATLPNREAITNYFISYVDLSTGLSWTTQWQDVITTQLSASVAHINKPQASFTQSDNRIHPRFAVFLISELYLSKEQSLIISGFYQQQRNATEKIAGVLYRQSLSIYHEDRGVSVGLFHRLDDAIIPVVQLNYDRFSVGISYDVNTSSLHRATKHRGGLEISISYTGLSTKSGKHHYKVPCPRL